MSRFGTSPLLLLLLFLFVSLTCLLVVNADSGDTDDPRARQVEIDDHQSDSVRCHSALTNGTFRNRVDFRVRANSNGIRFDYQFRPKDDNNTATELQFSVRFDRFVEYAEVGQVNGFDTHDVERKRIDLGTWNPVVVTPVDGNGTQVITATTTDQRIVFTVVIASQPFATFFAGQQINVTPNSIKFQIDANLTGYNYVDSSSRLAFRVQVFTEASHKAVPQNPQGLRFRMASGGGGGGGSGSGGGGSGSGGGGSGGGGADDTTNSTSNSGGNNSTGGGSSGGGEGGNSTVTPPSGDDGGRRRGGGGAAGCYYTCPVNCYYTCPVNYTQSLPGPRVGNQTEPQNVPRNDSARDAIEITRPDSTSAVKGVFEWVSAIEVDGTIVNLIPSTLSTSCENGDDNFACSNFFLSINATTPRIISWDPTITAGTKFVDAATGTNNPPTTPTASGASALSLVSHTFLLALLIAFFFF